VRSLQFTKAAVLVAAHAPPRQRMRIQGAKSRVRLRPAPQDGLSSSATAATVSSPRMGRRPLSRPRRGADSGEVAERGTSGQRGPWSHRYGHRAARVVVVAVMLFASDCGGSGTHEPASSAVATTSPSSSQSSTATSAGSSSSTTSTTVVPVPSTTLPAVNLPTLGPGASGPLVVALQRRLSTLGYWLDEETGVFDDATEQAVFAIQKAAGVARDGVVGPATESALIRGVQPRPRSSSGHVVEVDLTDDLLLIVTDGHLDATLNTSTGGGYAYRSQGQYAIAETPEGQFRIYRQVDGLVVNSLGELWRPKFFDDGFAIHGDSYVPPRPVSHGCVRVSNEAIDWIWVQNVMPLGTAVWVY